MGEKIDPEYRAILWFVWALGGVFIVIPMMIVGVVAIFTSGGC